MKLFKQKSLLIIALCCLSLLTLFYQGLGSLQLGTIDEDDLFSLELVASTFLGGWGEDIIFDCVTDEKGYIYLTGSTDSPLFPVTANAADSIFNAQDEAFLMKLDPTASYVLYSTFWGSTDSDVGASIALDNDNNIYIGGWTTSNNFPVSEDAFQTQFNGSTDGFITKFNPDGQMVYSTFVGGVQQDWINSIDVLSDGSVVAGGKTESPNFPVTPNGYDTLKEGSAGEAFLFHLSIDGSTQQYGTFLGGTSSSEEVMDLTVEGNDVIFSGYSDSLDFPIHNAYQDTIGGNSDAFIGRLALSTADLEFLTFLGGTSNEIGSSIALDIDGDIYCGGYTESKNFPTTSGAFDPSLVGLKDGFITRYLTNGTLIYSSVFGSTQPDEISDIIPYRDKTVLVVGNSYGSISITPTAFRDSGAGFFAILSTERPELAYSTFLTSYVNDQILAGTLGVNDSIILTGKVEDSSFPSTFGSYDPTYHSLGDGFLTIFRPSVTNSPCENVSATITTTAFTTELTTEIITVTQMITKYVTEGCNITTTSKHSSLESSTTTTTSSSSSSSSSSDTPGFFGIIIPISLVLITVKQQKKRN
ncbi:MAG: SBBP repeat-containing protein [Candidatus Hodarchaeales archaeon]|jgi:hypothetical protein